MQFCSERFQRSSSSVSDVFSALQSYWLFSGRFNSVAVFIFLCFQRGANAAERLARSQWSPKQQSEAPVGAPSQAVGPRRLRRTAPRGRRLRPSQTTACSLLLEAVAREGCKGGDRRSSGDFTLCGREYVCRKNSFSNLTVDAMCNLLLSKPFLPYVESAILFAQAKACLAVSRVLQVRSRRCAARRAGASSVSLSGQRASLSACLREATRIQERH